MTTEEGWLHVQRDGLPDENLTVLIGFPFSVRDEDIEYQLGYVERMGEETVWFDQDGFFILRPVSYYRYLPPPPEEK